MGLIDRLFRRDKQDKSTPLPSVSDTYGQFESSNHGAGPPSRRAQAKRKAARKRSKQSRRANR